MPRKLQTLAPRLAPPSQAVLPPTAWRIWALGMLALWTLALLFGPELLAGVQKIAGLHFDVHGIRSGHAQDAVFADTRALWGLPHAANVLSNLPFLMAGVLGLALKSGRALPPPTRRALALFFAGLVATGLGSAYYHFAPDVRGLVCDRLGMATAMAGLLALTVAERVHLAVADRARVGVLLVACVSALASGLPSQVLPWVLVQFGGLVFIAWASWRRPAAGALGLRFGAIIACYALAKLLEALDSEVLAVTEGLVSGHTLKHLVAVGAAWPVMAALIRAPRCQDAHQTSPSPA